MSDAKALLARIATLQAQRDASALVELEQHDDKQVRKAARKAIHVLRSKGVEIPSPESRSWANSGLEELRRHAGPIALLDLEAGPGVTRLTASMPEPGEGALLLMAMIDPDDNVVGFGAYSQTDGQQARMARDWQRVGGDRLVPVDWALARMRWGRERTFANNVPVPAALDEQLQRLGELPSARPEPAFLDDALASTEASASDLGEMLMRGGVHAWPLLFDANQLFERLAKRMEGVDPASASTEDRLAHIMDASKGDENLRAGLKGRIANALDDVAVSLWLDDELGSAKRIRGLAVELRKAAEPEQVPGIVNLVQLQITAAAMQQMREQGMMMPNQQEHHHEHEEECNDPSHHHHRH